MLLNLARDFDIEAFSDGSWVQNSSIAKKGGITLSKTLWVIYLCSGPVSSNNALESELAACKHIWIILGNQKKDYKCVICVDSKNLVDMVERAKAGLDDSRQGFEEIKDLAQSFPNCKVKLNSLIEFGIENQMI